MIKKSLQLVQSNSILFIFILIFLIPFYKIKFGLLSLQGADFYLQHFFARYFLSNELLNNFTLPLWDPRIFTGVPLIADPMNGIFYPFTYLSLLIPWENLYGIFIMLHLMLGIVFMFIFLKKGLGLSYISSIIGCTIFIFYHGLWHRILIGGLPFIQSYVWIPLIMHYYLCSLKQRKYFIHTCLAMTLQFLGGEPQVSYATNLFLGLLTLFMILNDLRNKRVIEAKYKGRIYFLIIIFFFLLSSIQFLPTLEFVKYTWRSGGVGYHEFFSSRSSPGLALALFVMFAIPGIIPFSIIFLSRKFLKREMVYSYSILYLFFLFLTAGGSTGLYELFYYYLPGLKYFREPDEFYTICNFIIAYLVAISFEKLSSADISRLKRSILYLGVAVHFLLLFIPSFRFIQPFDFNSNFAIYKKISQVTVSKDPLDRAVIFPFLFSRNPTISANSSILFNRENVFGYGPLSPDFVIKLFKEYSDIPLVNFMNTFGAKFLFTKEYLDSIALQLIYSDEFNIYRLKEETKRFYIARSPLSDEGLTLAEFLRDVTIEKEGKVVVGETILNELKSRIALVKEVKGADDSIRLIDYRPNRLALRVNMKSPGILVLKNNYHSGWKAWIDGESVPVFKTNLIFQGVFLNQGEHTVELKFMPLSFQIGLTISVITIFILAFLYVKYRKE